MYNDLVLSLSSLLIRMFMYGVVLDSIYVVRETTSSIDDITRNTYNIVRTTVVQCVHIRAFLFVE